MSAELEALYVEYKEASRLKAAELLKTQKQCAAMREALELCRSMLASYQQCGMRSNDAGMCIERADAALATDAGKNMVPLEDVRPLLDSLRLTEMADCFHEDQIRQKCLLSHDAFLAKHGHLLKGDK